VKRKYSQFVSVSFNPISPNVPEFSFVLVSEDQACNAVMSIKANGVDEILWFFFKSLLLVSGFQQDGGILWCCLLMAQQMSA
jgi:hypothetical protein